MKNKIILILSVIASLITSCQDANICPTTTPPITQANCPNPLIDPRDGQAYCTVTIGTQTWTAENMRYDTPDTIKDGIDITPNECNIEWYSFGTTSTFSDYRPIYGRYYNFPAIQYACPSGWHLPSEDEWKILEYYIGMDSVDVEDNGTDWRGSQGVSLKSTQYWTTFMANVNWGTGKGTAPGTPYGNGTNSTGFNAYPSGCIVYGWNTNNLFHFIDLGTLASFGGYRHPLSGTYGRGLHFSTEAVSRGAHGTLNSCRCIKD